VIDFLQLGNGAMQPLPDRWLSSFLVRCDADLILLDCGEGTQIAARRFGWGFKRIAAICISHHHADHIAGLPGILMCIANAGRNDPVTIFGPRDTFRIVQALLAICPALPFDLRVVEFADGDSATVAGHLRVRVLEVAQRGMPVLVWRFELARQRRFDRAAAERDHIPRDQWSTLQSGDDLTIDGVLVAAERYLGPPRPGIAFGFVTDTRPDVRIVELVRDADLLICEATYLDEADHEKAIEVDHFVLSESCQLAADAAVDRLLLTHFSASYPDPLAFEPAAQARFPHAEIGFSGWTTTLSFPDED